MVSLERSGDDVEYLITPIVFSRTKEAGWLPKPTENDQVYVVDRIGGGCLLV
jgi:hypothetical protein